MEALYLARVIIGLSPSSTISCSQQQRFKMMHKPLAALLKEWCWESPTIMQGPLSAVLLMQRCHCLSGGLPWCPALGPATARASPGGKPQWCDPGWFGGGGSRCSPNPISPITLTPQRCHVQGPSFLVHFSHAAPKSVGNFLPLPLGRVESASPWTQASHEGHPIASVQFPFKHPSHHLSREQILLHLVELQLFYAK